MPLPLPHLLAAVTLTAAAASAGPASAEDCTYTDLLGTFEVSVDCAGLQDHSNLGNEQKRLWLAGDWGQVNVLEVPSPYKQDATQIGFIMSNLGRVYTERRSPGGIQDTTIAGQDAKVVLEHKMRTSSRSWVFHWEGRNLIMRAVAYGKKKERMERLDAMSAALTSSFAAASATPEPKQAEKRPKVRDRKLPDPAEAVEPVNPVEAEAAEALTEGAPAETAEEAEKSSSKARAEATAVEAAAAEDEDEDDAEDEDADATERDDVPKEEEPADKPVTDGKDPKVKEAKEKARETAKEAQETGAAVDEAATDAPIPVPQ